MIVRGMIFDRVDEHKNINGTNRRRINNSLKYSAPRLSRYADRDLQKEHRVKIRIIHPIKIHTRPYWEDQVHVQWVNDQGIPSL